MKIELQEHYGSKVWTHVVMDELRRTECLCRRCELLKPGRPDNCQYAERAFAVCKDGDIALSVTRCRDFQDITIPKDDGRPGKDRFGLTEVCSGPVWTRTEDGMTLMPGVRVEVRD